MSVRYINKKGEEVEISPCFFRIEDLKLPDLNYKSRLSSLLSNPIQIPPVIYNPILENFKISYELEKEKKARLILEERVKKLEKLDFKLIWYMNIELVVDVPIVK